MAHSNYSCCGAAFRVCLQIMRTDTHARVHVCLHKRVQACTHKHVHTRGHAHARMRTLAHTRTHGACACSRARTRQGVHACGGALHANAHAKAHVYMKACVCEGTHTREGRMSRHMHAKACACENKHTQRPAYTRARTHTGTHAQRHTGTKAHTVPFYEIGPISAAMGCRTQNSWGN